MASDVFQTLFGNISHHSTYRRFLDIACGEGDSLSIIYDKLYPSLTQFIAGIDIDHERLLAAKSRWSADNIIFLRQSALQIGFSDHSFDGVLMVTAIHHMADVRQSLAEAIRVLRTDGLFIIDEQITDNPSPAQKSQIMYHRFIADVDRVRGIPHYPTYSRYGLDCFIDELSLSSLTSSVYTPKNEPSDDFTKDLVRKIEERLKLIADSNHYRKLCEKANRVIQHTRLYGIERPNHVVYVGVK